MSTSENQSNLHDFNITLSRMLEQAEAKIPRLNEIVERIASVGLINGVVLLGEVMLDRPYSVGSGPEDSGQVLQATILIPGGIGATTWDADEYCRLKRTPGELEANAKARFVAFADLHLAEKALLMMCTPPLLTRLCSMVLPMGFVDSFDADRN